MGRMNPSEEEEKQNAIAKVEQAINRIEERPEMFGAFPLLIEMKDGRRYMIALSHNELSKLPKIDAHHIAQLCGLQLLRAMEKGEESQGE